MDQQQSTDNEQIYHLANNLRTCPKKILWIHMNVDTNNGLGELPFQFSIKKQNVKYLRVPFLFVLLTSRQSLSYAPITSSRNLLRFR